MIDLSTQKIQFPRRGKYKEIHEKKKVVLKKLHLKWVIEND